MGPGQTKKVVGGRGVFGKMTFVLSLLAMAPVCFLSDVHSAHYVKDHCACEQEKPWLTGVDYAKDPITSTQQHNVTGHRRTS